MIITIIKQMFTLLERREHVDSLRRGGLAAAVVVRVGSLARMDRGGLNRRQTRVKLVSNSSQTRVKLASNFGIEEESNSCQTRAPFDGGRNSAGLGGGSLQIGSLDPWKISGDQ